ncbi:hypothetical protein KP509_12G035600 [Ceratopteris richardii]|uniref:Elongin-C n=1 Tax=Ceratopteris richardii TaxID=49495 RepID=A0A8T2TMT8_CERRI|nr:hypothetical protein KP509_12G035600 [Ceratopteris richardii]
MAMRKEDTIKLVSAEGFEFVIDRKAAVVSDTLKSMLNSTGSNIRDAELGEVKLPEISTPVLEKVCEFFYWSLQFSNGIETEFDIEPEMTSDLMRAANLLHT